MATKLKRQHNACSLGDPWPFRVHTLLGPRSPPPLFYFISRGGGGGRGCVFANPPCQPPKVPGIRVVVSVGPCAPQRWASALVYHPQPPPPTLPQDMSWCQAYALQNRRVMIEALADIVADVTGHRADMGRAVNIHHNYATREVATYLDHATGRRETKELWITRKGATSAKRGQYGIIPGSMGVGSFIVRGKVRWCSAVLVPPALGQGCH